MTNIAIVGANGYLGRMTSNYFNQNFTITEYSSKPNVDNNAQLHINKILDNIEIHDLIIFFCYSQSISEQKKIENLFSQICAMNQPTILISSFTLYSNYSSQYNVHKKKLEKIIQSSNKWIILRPGLIHGNIKTGLIKIMTKFRKFPILILPGSDSKTGVAHINYFLEELKKIILKKQFNKIHNIFYEKMSLYNILRLTGFRGIVLSIRVKFIKPFIKTANFFSFLVPNILESYLSLLGMDENKYKSEDIDINSYLNKYYLLRIIFYNHIVLFKSENNFKLYRIIKNIIRSTTLKSYLALNNESKFLFHAKINEINLLKNH
tara:strand:- start:148 stop:1110 length:963 start_codon:yes stop_codon:yes gene_type:complete